MKIFINLLPPDKKRDIRTGMVLAYVQTMMLFLFVILTIVSGTLISLRITLNGEHDHLKLQTQSATSSESTDIMSNIRQINSYLASAETIQDKFIPWSDVIMDMASMVPDNTRLYRFRTDQANRIFIDGTAATRDESLSLMKSLQDSPYLSDVKSPLSNILQKTDVQFNYEMSYGMK